MRTIGHISNEASARRFSRHLAVQGIDHELEESGSDWDVWIRSDDDLARASELFRGYQANPNDLKYAQPPPLPKAAAIAAPAPREKESDSEDATPAKTDGDEAATLPPGIGILTVVIMGVCLLVQVMRVGGYDESILREMFMTAMQFDGNFHKWTPGLLEISRGEVWRLFTPVLVHNDWLHLLLNLFMFIQLAAVIEYKAGTRLLAMLILVIAVASNYGQYLMYSENFCGISGVVYGLLGFVWMRGRFDPASGYHLPLQSLVMMIVWFVLCAVGLIPNIANGTHGVGLVVGGIWGMLASLPAWKRQRA